MFGLFENEPFFYIKRFIKWHYLGSRILKVLKPFERFEEYKSPGWP